DLPPARREGVHQASNDDSELSRHPDLRRSAWPARSPALAQLDHPARPPGPAVEDDLAALPEAARPRLRREGWIPADHQPGFHLIERGGPVPDRRPLLVGADRGRAGRPAGPAGLRGASRSGGDRGCLRIWSDLARRRAVTTVVSPWFGRGAARQPRA